MGTQGRGQAGLTGDWGQGTAVFNNYPFTLLSLYEVAPLVSGNSYDEYESFLFQNAKFWFEKKKKKNIICIHPFLSLEKNTTSILLSVQWLLMECGSVQSHLGRTFVTNHSMLKQLPAGCALCLGGGKKKAIYPVMLAVHPVCSAAWAKVKPEPGKKLLTVMRGDDAAK